MGELFLSFLLFLYFLTVVLVPFLVSFLLVHKNKYQSMKIKNINVKIPYWDEGMKNPFEWYKKGWYKRYYRKRLIKIHLKEYAD